jgi:LmbE family N-acetylglucosaminyl deacetylase
VNTVLVIAPHPDDELIGCGGTILRHIADGDSVHWLIMTAMTEQAGFDREQITARQEQIDTVVQDVGFTARHELGLPTAHLDTLPLARIVEATAQVIGEVRPDTLYLPYGGDVHSDHGVTFAAARGCSKWFRHPSVRRIYSYETLSETDFALPPHGPGMPIQRYVDISAHLERKLELLDIYASEFAAPPFPRSKQSISALALLRGAAAGCIAAEAFQVLKEIY